MKPALAFPTETQERDAEAFWGELATRLAAIEAIPAGEWSQGLRFFVRFKGASLIAIIEPEPHGEATWYHLSLSCARPARVPSWDELKWAKEVFLGDRKALMVFPSKAEYVNDHPHVLHLFAGPDGLPDLRGFGFDGAPSI